MSNAEIALLIGGMAAVTFLIRYPILAIVGRIQLPPEMRDALQYVPVAVLTAIIMPAVLLTDGQPDIALDNAYLVAGMVAAGVAYWSRNLTWTILVGMMFFLVWRAVM